MPAGTPRAVSARRAAVLAVCGLLIAGGGLLLSVRAYAAFVPVPPTGTGVLRVDSDPYPARFDAIAPGESKQVQLRVRLDGASSGSLSMQLRGSGPLVQRTSGLNIAMESCTSAFEGASPHLSCAPGGHVVLPQAPLASVATSTSSSSWALTDIVRDNARFLLVTLSMPSDAEASAPVDGLTGNFAIGLYASGDDAARPAVQPPLADTGLDIAGPLLVALGALGIGLVIRARRKEREQMDAQKGAEA